MDMMAMRETVIGKPRDCGHLFWLVDEEWRDRGIIPVQAVDVENLGDPHQCCDVVKSVIHK